MSTKIWFSDLVVGFSIFYHFGDSVKETLDYPVVCYTSPYEVPGSNLDIQTDIYLMKNVQEDYSLYRLYTLYI